MSAGLLASPAMVQDANPSPQVTATQIRGVSANESRELIGMLRRAQDALRRHEPLYFELLSGAPASYPMTSTSPREAFLAVDFERAFSVERAASEGASRGRYRVIVLPNGVGNLLWDIAVVVDVDGEIARVEMLYRPPSPF